MSVVLLVLSGCARSSSPESAGRTTSTRDGPPVSVIGEDEPDVVIQFEPSASMSEVERVALLISPVDQLARFVLGVDYEDKQIFITGSPNLTDDDRQQIRAAVRTSGDVQEVSGL
ncbi:MAG: hypothetical protein ACT452_11015 [Microthrixaceae bacterium]